MDRLSSMGVFVRVVDEGSFAAAARSLQISAPTVTRAVASLEDHLGTQLLTRTTRSVVLTESGRRYLEDCRAILADIDTAEAAAAGSLVRPRGTLHVTAPVEFGQRYVLPVLGGFLDEHPAVDARTLFLDRIVHMVDEGMDVAVRIGHLPDSSLRAIRVGFVRQVLLGAPAYLDKRGSPESPAELVEHDVVAVTRTPAPIVKWSFGDTQAEVVSVTPRLRCNTIASGLRAAEAGWGLTRLLSYQAHDAIVSGRLRRLLASHEPRPAPVHLVHPDARHTSPKVRAFLDFAEPRLRARLSEISKAFS